MKKEFAIVTGILVIMTFSFGFVLTKFIEKNRQLKECSRKFEALEKSKTDTIIVEKWREIDTTGLIKWYLSKVPMKRYSPAPPPDLSKPGVITQPCDTSREDFYPALKTLNDTFDRPDFYMNYTIQAYGDIAGFRINKYKIKLIETTYNHVVHDTIPIPVPVIRSHFGGYFGLAAKDFKGFPGMEAGLWYEHKDKWGIEAGALYLDESFYGTLKARFTFK